MPALQLRSAHHAGILSQPVVASLNRDPARISQNGNRVGSSSTEKFGPVIKCATHGVIASGVL